MGGAKSQVVCCTAASPPVCKTYRCSLQLPSTRLLSQPPPHSAHCSAVNQITQVEISSTRHLLVERLCVCLSCVKTNAAQSLPGARRLTNDSGGRRRHRGSPAHAEEKDPSKFFTWSQFLPHVSCSGNFSP